MTPETAAQLLGPRYSWAVHTVPVQKLIDYITALEDRLNEAAGVKACECPPEPQYRRLIPGVGMEP
jgi:hypothetical protein